MADTLLEQLAKSDRNPIQEEQYRKLLSEQNLPYFQGGNLANVGQFRAATGYGQPQVAGQPGGAGGGLQDIVGAAKQIQQFTSEANKPVIQSLEAQRTPLLDRYSALLDQIKGNQATAEKRQSMATSQEFGRRGIPLSSGVFQQTLADVLNPITSQYTNLYKETGAGREQDLLALAQQIAQLQAGQPGQALSQALQFGGYQQQAQSLAAQQANQQATQELARRTLEESEKNFNTIKQQ
ncbi:MAG: hypothetical protein AABY15_09800, partial [Nanoarchaeota archaeon]